MPRSFLVKKKRGACGAWQWREPELHEWKEDNAAGKNFMYLEICCQLDEAVTYKVVKAVQLYHVVINLNLFVCL